MKVAAHPLVVAAALGLVGPGALELDLDEGRECSGCVDQVIPSRNHELSELYTVPAPSPEEFAAVELEWLRVTARPA